MNKLTVCMMTTNHEAWIKYSLGSALEYANRIIIIDGGSKDTTLEIIDSFRDPRIEVYHHSWTGNNGGQRNKYLRQLENGEWTLVLDSDEVIGDTGYLLRQHMDTPRDCYNVRMEHFIGNFGFVDNTQPVHYALRRFFRFNPAMRYEEVMHPVLQGNISLIGNIDDVCLYHYSYVNGVGDVLRKYNENMQRSNMHTKEYLQNWKNMHLLGTYPVRKFNISEHPRIIREALL